MGQVTSGDPLREAVAELYSCDPGEFVERRRVLAARARAAGETALAKRIAGLRKPTRSAWVLNQLVRAAPAVTSQLSALGEELRAAQRSLDGAAIRELSVRRRQLIDALARQAFTVSGQESPSAVLRDEVTATLGAALADPQFAERLREGALVEAAHRDGFGPPAVPAVPAVTLLPSLPGRARAAAAKGAATAPAPSAMKTNAMADARERAERERHRRAIAAAERATAERATAEQAAAERATAERATAEQAAAERATAERAAAERAMAEADRAAVAAARTEREHDNAVRLIEEQLTEARQRLAEAKAQARRAMTGQRRARQALDRLQGHPRQAL
jgi:flagellar biosynthesis GTPase FlhF